MKTFLTVWIGQLISIIGSGMTNFAVTIWAWKITNQATPLSLIIFSTAISEVIAASFAGIVVDRWNRKYIMIMGDLMAGVSTIVIFVLFSTDNLQIWHLYLTAFINGFFSYFQRLAFSTSISLIVKEKDYMAASAINGTKGAGGHILAPALGGVLYHIIGLKGILVVDFCTFIIAISTILFIHLPQPKQERTNYKKHGIIWKELTFGFSYIYKNKNLLWMAFFLILFVLFLSINLAILAPMILARSGNQETILANIQTAFGLGGLTSAVVINIWGGPKKRIHGFLGGIIFQFMGLIMMCLVQNLWQWFVIAFSSGFVAIFPPSSNQAIWLSKVEKEIQGKVFATRFLMTQIAASFGAIISGPLADKFFEPAMENGGSLAGIFGGIFGTGPGAGMALQLSIVSLLAIIIILFGYRVKSLKKL